MCRLILTAGLCLIITVLASAKPIDKFCNGKRNGDYANPNYPNSYISCSNGLTYVRYCQAGLIFRESLDRCDWPTTAVSSDKTSTATKTACGGTIDQFCNGKRDGDYANPNDPNSFITCSNGLTYVRYCQAGLIFRESLDICDWPTAAVSSDKTSTATKTACGGTIDQFCNGKRDGDYANPNDPNSFITCSNGLTYVRYCQAGLIFRESLDICDWPTAAVSSDKTSTATKTACGGTIDQFCNGKTDGDYANPNDPNSFITCSNGLTYVRYCQAGLIFRESLDICDWPTTAPPNDKTPTATKTTSAGTIDQFCKGKRDGDYTNPKNQYTFYTCSNGLTYLRDCPAGLIFRESLDICDWPTTAPPNDKTPTATKTTTAKGQCDGGDKTHDHN